MAFSTSVTSFNTAGRKRQTSGTWSNTLGSSGGTMSMGLKYVDTVTVECTSHLGMEAPKITLNSPLAGQATIVLSTQTGTAMSGIWKAYGI